MDLEAPRDTPPGPFFVHARGPCLVRLGVAERPHLRWALSDARPRRDRRVPSCPALPDVADLIPHGTPACWGDDGLRGDLSCHGHNDHPLACAPSLVDLALPCGVRLC